MQMARRPGRLVAGALDGLVDLLGELRQVVAAAALAWRGEDLRRDLEVGRRVLVAGGLWARQLRW